MYQEKQLVLKCTRNIIEANCGDYVGINVKGLSNDNIPRIGEIMCIIDDTNIENTSPISTPIATLRSVKQFTALVFVQDHPGYLRCSKYDKKTNQYRGGFTPMIHICTARAPCQMIKVEWKMSRASNNTRIEFPQDICAGDQAQVIFKPLRPIIVCAFEDCNQLARIAFMDSNTMVMIGKVIALEES